MARPWGVRGEGSGEEKMSDERKVEQGIGEERRGNEEGWNIGEVSDRMKRRKKYERMPL